ncbi:MAG TPA: hypothetical protein VMI33_04085 [Streptosporangiaceae bacterium]|nr:hypothetical protein [Streptosporangiaceae bacterium]
MHPAHPAPDHEAEAGGEEPGRRAGVPPRPRRGTDPADDANCWREATRLRREHPGWVVLWLDRTREYRAYRLTRARCDSVLTAGTPADLVAQISAAEQAARAPRA